MQFSQPEIIQLLRRRIGLNQATLGARAFNTSMDSGRTKIKNIELGKQACTYDDLRKMAAVLGVEITDLMPEKMSASHENKNMDISIRLALHPRVADLFPGLMDYLGVLNKAVILDDDELVSHSCKKIISLMDKKVDLAASQ